MGNEEKAAVVLLLFVLVGLVAFSSDVMAMIQTFTFKKFIPLDVVFDDGIDLSKYDGGVILNCLRDKNFCPEGVHYKDDVTGEVFASNPDQPKTFQPVVGAPDPTPDMFINDVPVNDLLKTSDSVSIAIYVIIIAVVSIAIILYIFKIRKNRK